MTTLGQREECLRNHSEKAHFRALGARRTRNRPFPATLVAPWARTGGEPVKPCWGRPFGL